MFGGHHPGVAGNGCPTFDGLLPKTKQTSSHCPCLVAYTVLIFILWLDLWLPARSFC